LRECNPASAHVGLIRLPRHDKTRLAQAAIFLVAHRRLSRRVARKHRKGSALSQLPWVANIALDIRVTRALARAAGKLGVDQRGVAASRVEARRHEPLDA
jgi:hypothetical protein